jgi:NAD-dependent SIR2 family protein deacetylase
MTMSETVFILGAGASMHAGAPGMLDFLDVADRLRRTKRVPDGDVGDAFDQVLAGRAALDPVFAKASIDADNLEAVFGAFEMAQLFGQFGTFTAEEINALPNAMRTVIVETLELTTKYPFPTSESRYPNAPVLYDQLGHLLSEMRAKDQSVSVITFNYDVALDYALYRRGIHIDYCLTPNTEASGHRQRIDLMKLHGSINWTTCPQCRVVPYRFEQFLQTYRWDFVEPPTAVCINFRQPLVETFKHDCNGAKGDGLSVIVPPTWNKATGHREIVTVWRRAVKHLSDARHIIVIGYSLPPSDQFFRYLYALGTVSATRLEKFWLIDPDSAPGGAGDRFRDLLGKGVQRRFHHEPSSLTDSTFRWLQAALFTK